MSVVVRKSKKGWIEVDIRTHTADGTPIRERLKAPVSTKAAAKLWAEQREAHLALAHGLNGCRCKTRGEEDDGVDPRTVTTRQFVESWIEQRKA
jgi:hypothetical protein